MIENLFDPESPPDPLPVRRRLRNGRIVGDNIVANKLLRKQPRVSALVRRMVHIQNDYTWSYFDRMSLIRKLKKELEVSSFRNDYADCAQLCRQLSLACDRLFFGEAIMYSVCAFLYDLAKAHEEELRPDLR